MQLTEQQRAELERRGWRVKWRTGSFETWEHPAYSVGVHVWANGEIGAMGNIGEVLEFAAAVGYAPPGYRLVPEHVAHEAIQQALDDQNDGYVWVPFDTWEALVSALEGEEKR